MSRKKSEYALLFEQLYEKYIEEGDNDFTWSYIHSKTASFIAKFVNKSSLFTEHYDEGVQEANIAMMRAFRTYDSSRGASLFTWVCQLCKQTIYKLIKDKTKYVSCDYLEEIDIDFEDEALNPEDELINAQFLAKEDELKRRLEKVLGGPIEVEVFAMKNGLFGYNKMDISEIAEESCLTKKTIYFLNKRNNRMLKELRKDKEKLAALLK